MNCPGILKRGYLFDKKVGILPMTVDRKRWYILKQDPTQNHRVVLEFYKDERSASKGDSPKGFINIRDVVAIHRLADKKQSFEILCPGVGYRLMANSELEADEWTVIIRNHISYKREDVMNDRMKSLSLTRVQSSGGVPHLTPPLHERQRTLSDSAQHLHLPPSYQHPQQQQQQQQQPQQHQQHQLLQPRAIPIATTHHHQMPHETTHSMVHLSHSLPTPPDSLPSPPSFSHFPVPPGFVRQRSLEMAPSLPSPSTSSDSSSMCSGSNTSFEGPGGAVFESDLVDTKSVFRVQVKETESLAVVGPADLLVSEDGLRLQSLSTDQRELVFWPLSCLRRYGVNNHCFTIITGRFCATGEGRFQFYTDESRVIHAKLHGYATQKAAISGKSRSMPRRSSEPTEFGGVSPQATPIHSLNLTQSLPPHVHASQTHMFQSNDSVSSRSHDYSHLHHFLPHGSVPTHRYVYTHAVTQPISVGQQQQRMPNQQYMAHLSPTNHMQHMPLTVTSPSHMSPQMNPNSYTSCPGSVPNRTPQFQSGDQNQSLHEAKSASSGSSLGSGGESVGGASSGGASSSSGPDTVHSKSPETLYPISDQEDEPAAVDVTVQQ